MKKTIRIKGWWVILAFVVVGIVFLAASQSLRSRVYWKFTEWYADVFYWLKPPEEEVFVPQESGITMPPTTVIVPTLTKTPEPGLPSSTPTATLQPTQTPLPLPEKVVLEGVKYTDQHGLWNYCAPANLTMALSYWGVDVPREVVGRYLKPEDLDRNVKPYEMANYIEEETTLGVAVREGGDLEVIKRLVAAGYPVVIEKGLYMPQTPGSVKIIWMGHYNLIVGYDETKQEFISHDSYLSPPEYDLFLPISYDDLITQWRAFNYIFMVVYPLDQYEEVSALLGDYVDPTWAIEHARDIALEETGLLHGEDLFFAWFNYGSSLRMLFDYGPASTAFDTAFQIYATLDPDRRPWRMMWYQTGPYYAYFYTGRYQDVIDLATTTIEASSQPYIEESWYWRGQARQALGDIEGALGDFRQSLVYHPGFAPSLEAIALMGYEP